MGAGENSAPGEWASALAIPPIHVFLPAQGFAFRIRGALAVLQFETQTTARFLVFFFDEAWGRTGDYVSALLGGFLLILVVATRPKESFFFLYRSVFMASYFSEEEGFYD
jgi:hypothetical protein